MFERRHFKLNERTNLITRTLTLVILVSTGRMNAILLSFALLVVTSRVLYGAPIVGVDRPTERSEFKESFDKIDDYLMKNVDKDDPEANLEAAREWLKKEQSANGDINLIEALTIFTGLATILKGDTCHEASMKILMMNDSATDGHALDPSKDVSKLRRIEKIIDFYATKQADLCITEVQDTVDTKSGSTSATTTKDDATDETDKPGCLPDGKMKTFFSKMLNNYKAKKEAYKKKREEKRIHKMFWGHSGGGGGGFSAGGGFGWIDV